MLTMTNKEENKTPAGKQSWLKSNRFKHGAMAKVFTVAFLVVVVLINVIVGAVADRFPSFTRFDLTSSSLNSLSEESMAVAKEVSNPTVIYMIGSENAIKNDQLYQQYNVKYSQILNLVQRFAEKNSNISYEIVDPDKNPSFISKYADAALTSGSVLVESDKRYKALGPTDLFTIAPSYDQQGQMSYAYFSTADSSIANALYLTNLEDVPVIAIASGHDEMLTSTSSNSSATMLTAFEKMLSNNNYDVQHFSILTEEIPEGASLVMLPTPTTDYTTAELDKLDAYLADQKEQSHTVFVTFHPTQGELPNLTAFLQEWGIVPEAGKTIYETDASKQYGGAFNVFAQYVEDEAIRLDTGVYNRLLMPATVPMRLDEDSHNYVSRYVLMQGSDTSYASDKERPNPDTETVPAVVMSQQQWTVGNKFYNANVIACGSSAMFLPDFIGTSTFDNGKYLLDLFAYATDSSDLSSGLSTNRIQTYEMDVTASDATLTVFGLGIFTIGIPVVVLAIGLIVFLRRRHL